MHIPISTYRVQFHKEFSFVDAYELVPYLHDLGVGDLYSSPWFKARRGSSHGYDIADPMRINPELGSEEQFEELALKLQNYEMGLLLDIVPNHMSASAENPWWMDVLENGQASRYAEFFDIDWHPATSKAPFLQDDRVLLPILGDLYGNVLNNQELSLRIDDAGLFVRYYETRLPLDLKTYSYVLGRTLEIDPWLGDLREILAAVERLPSRDERDPERIAARRSGKDEIRTALWKAYFGSAEVKHAIDETLREINGTKGNPATFDALDGVLSAQAYRLAHWKIGYEEINYRRFFDINDLVGLRVEVPEVFALRHEKSLQVVRDGKVTGFRIDHPDGLYDPLGYLQRLQESIGCPDGFYVVVEKILGTDERLSDTWPVSGTTGYEFLNALNGLFVHPQGLAALNESYARRTGITEPFEEICYAANKKVIGDLFRGEVNALGHELGELAAHDRQARDVPLSELMEALVEMTACLPVYRTYIRDFTVPEADRARIERTIRVARERTSPDHIGSEAFAFLRRVLLLEPRYYAEDQKSAMLSFIMRWQQFTGPVMAKGLEDTASYRHNSLISLNEVGGDPLRLTPPMDLAGFHEFNRRRAERWHGGLNATSTHDTKRGEDARARINVLSEVPREWEEQFDCWSKQNEALKRRARGETVPGPNEEYLIYQTLLGTWPGEEDMAGYAERICEFVTKASREAKMHTSWIQPDAEWEAAICGFASDVLVERRFLDSFLPFQKQVAFYGALNGLAQALVKIASPGVPDFYQGSELWNLSMVDPDNRRPVDYRKRREMLDEIRRREAEDRQALAAELAGDPVRAEAKLYVVARALEFRREHAALFAEGEYAAVAASGAHAANAIAFARWKGDEWALAVAPRWLTQLGCKPPSPACDWGDTVLQLPESAPAQWRDAFTGADVTSAAMSDVLRRFPVALLEGG